MGRHGFLACFFLFGIIACGSSDAGNTVAADGFVDAAEDGSADIVAVFDSSDAAAPAVCGDGVCNGDETCETCDDCLEQCPDPCADKVCGSDGRGGECGFCDPSNDEPCFRNLCADGQCAMGGVSDGVVCDDGDPCTVAEKCTAGVCGGGVDNGGCGGSLESCELSGAVGDVVECSIRLAAKTESAPRAASMGHRVLYDDALVRLVRLSCPMDLPTGTDTTVDTCDHPTSPTLPFSFTTGAGHNILTNPQDRNDWAGNVKFVLFPAGVPKIFNDAYLAPDGKVIGDPNLYRLVFELLAAIDEETPTPLEITEMDLSDVDGNLLKGSIQGTLILVEGQ